MFRIKADWLEGLHSETQSEEGFGEGSEAAFLDSPIGEDRVNDALSTVTKGRTMRMICLQASQSGGGQ